MFRGLSKALVWDLLWSWETLAFVVFVVAMEQWGEHWLVRHGVVVERPRLN